MKRTVAIVLSLMLVAGTGTLGMAFAAELTPDGNDRKGKYLYRKNCRTCHTGDKAPELSPVSKTQAKWKAAFADLKTIPCSKDWKTSDKDLKDIYSYLFNHAYDSPSPAKCK